jgi:hypothetical protein
MPKKQEDTDHYKGYFMKNKKLPSFLALSISLELMISPVPALAETTASNVISGVGQALNLGMNTYNTLRGGQGQQQMSPHVATDMAAFKNQQTPAADKHFTLNNMQKIPGLMEYVAKKNQDAAKSGGKPIDPRTLQCATLPTTLSEPNNEVCRNKEVNAMAGDPKAQADEAFAYYNQLLQVQTTYTNFTKTSNVGGQGFGDGCMEDAMTVLKGFFAYRVEQLDTVVAELEAATAKFEEQSEMDLKSIRESSAILGGEGSKFATEFKNSDLFDYGKRFEDPACNSILSKDGMDAFGKGNGLVGIEKKLKESFGTTPEGSKYSPESYLKNHADVVSDIKKMAEKVSEQATLNFSQISSGQEGYSAFLNGVGSDVGSESGASAGLNKAFFSDLQTKFTKTRNSLSDEAKLISSELGGKGGAALGLLSNIDNDTNFDAEIGSLENEIKGECVNKSGIDIALARIYDPTLSKSANKHSSEQVKKKLKAILEDVTISPEKKLAEIKQIQAAGGSYEMKMDADYETNEVAADGSIVKKKVNAAGKVSPASYFTDVIKNCESQYQVNKLKNKLSAKQAIQKLRTLKKEFQKAATQHSKDIKNEIVKKMVDCGGNGAVASSSAVGSCSPEKLNMSSPGFCAKAAFSCSSNMKQCSEKAQKFVKDIKGDRLKRTNNYNNNVESTRKQMVAMFDTAMVKYMKEAESLRGMFGAGFAAPKDIQRDIKGGAEFDQKFAQAPDALEVKDPKQYLAMVKGNMEKLQAQVKAQQEAIVSDGGPLAKHIAETKKNHAEVIKKSGQLAGNCLAAYNSYKSLVKAQKEGYDKLQGALGEKTAAFCGRYQDVMSSNPIPGCDDGYAEVSDAMILAATQAGNAYTAAEARRMRSEMAETCNKPGNQRDKDGKSATTAADVCARADLNDAIAKKAILKYPDLCADLASTKCDEVEVPATATTAAKVTKPCEKKEGLLVAYYNAMLVTGSNGSLVAGTSDDPQPSQASNDTGSFCNGGNNSGPFNTKGGFPQGGGSLAGPFGSGAGIQ